MGAFEIIVLWSSVVFSDYVVTTWIQPDSAADPFFPFCGHCW